MWRRELCKVGRANRMTTAMGKRGGSNRVEKTWLAAREESSQNRSSPRDETAEAPPKKHRDKPSSHTNWAGGGGETEWDITKVGCGNLTSKESERVSTSCRLELVDGAHGRYPPKPWV